MDLIISVLGKSIRLKSITTSLIDGYTERMALKGRLMVSILIYEHSGHTKVTTNQMYADFEDTVDIEKEFPSIINKLIYQRKSKICLQYLPMKTLQKSFQLQ